MALAMEQDYPMTTEERAVHQSSPAISNAGATSPLTSTPTYSYPGGHALGSSNLFISIYDEEEYYERILLDEELYFSPASSDPCCSSSEAYQDASTISKPPAGMDVNVELDGAQAYPPSGSGSEERRRTIYHLLRLFDSIRGFHKGYLDLSGRHPERYFTLQTQWSRFLCNFVGLGTEFELRTGEVQNDSHFTSRIQGHSSHTKENKYCIMFNSDRWRRFQMKWRLPETTTYSQILKYTQRVLRAVKQNPTPVFQTLDLWHLPNEVLDNIFWLASMEQAKALSMTCRRLNDVGQRQIFRTWHMKLHVPPHISPFNVEYSGIDLPTLAHYCRQELEKNAQFLLSNPHISGRMQRLVLTDEWWASRRAAPSNENNPFMLGMEFYRSVTQIFGSVLKIASGSLNTLVLCNLEINCELVRRVAEVPTLHTLELHLCHIPRTVRRKLEADPAFMFPQVSNLRIYMDSSFPETHSQWYSLFLCPHVRTLSVVQFGVGTGPPATAGPGVTVGVGTATPTIHPTTTTHPHGPTDATSAFWSRCRMDHLERLSVDNIDWGDLVEFMGFLKNHRKAVMHMTHFKLHMDWGIPDFEMMETVLLALEHAPMEVLVLEGLADAGFELFDGIAQQYPHLVALTLVRRQNRNQHTNKLALWPRSSWEYAEHVKGFRKLKHFCWNFLTEYWDATPIAILAFEAGFQAASPSSSSSVVDAAASTGDGDDNALPATSAVEIFPKNDEVPYFLDSHMMALPFAAHCPTLESFSLMDRTLDMVCRIERHPVTKAVRLIPKYYPTTTTTVHVGHDSSSVSYNGGWSDMDQVLLSWNTTRSYWPRLLPLSAKSSLG